ncbi:hypothetical protein LTR10_014514 [Elasticomyces elasticus]|uniref:N-acetyltransferase domain-containing protein n=1 Tax=Exophiala sideris TaxID=1016849 RepID=A0ABR0JSF0_9EURO|nr:hypothetical protein LTR10_014514 [Elasticomyces elasticus]KAK5040493.1 hypothetical protein LTS07_000991 [Exophiala sideris]KAK5068871.1 hypothetical protein LTR69_000992 [Exophiala sideris]KAK5186467.1 hypothetical protein LTR44_001523 [Eurotiomycetes sp. CCFEE 6388]
MILSLSVPYLCILLIHRFVCIVASSIPPQQFLDLSGGPILRNATIADVSAIVDIVDAAFSPSAPTKYRYQFKDKYPQEHRRCMYEAYLEVFDPEYVYVQVIELPASSGRGDSKPVSVAAWVDGKKVPTSDMQGWNQWNSGSALSSKCTHKDENATRAADWQQKFAKEHNKYLNDVYGHNQFYLAVLATHPDFQGRGYGEQLVLSGIEMAPILDLDTVTLIATPVGEPVYFSLGFRPIANISITSVDEDMAFPFDVMVYP